MSVDLNGVRLTAMATTGVPHASAVAPTPDDDGTVRAALPDSYREVEHLLTGVARTYSGQAVGPPVAGAELTPYATRLLVRLPAEADRFSGRVVIEPFNTSSGVDRDVVWQHVDRLLVANGDAWVGVTERTSSARALVARDPQRYAGLDVSSNDLAWDILRQVGALVRAVDHEVLAGLTATHVYLVGYSQSGCETATFASAFHDLTRAPSGDPVYDGYFPAARGASLTALGSGRAVLPGLERAALRPLDVPVIDLETQTDVEGFTATLSGGRTYVNPGSATVRREDSDAPGDLFRLWEVAGAPHTPGMAECDGPPSSFPTAAFLRAGLAALFAWAEHGVAPPRAPRLDLAVADVVSVTRADEVGNGCGGVRSPHLDLPLVTFLVHSTPGALCALAGQEVPLTQQELIKRHGAAEAYLDSFAQRLEATIAAGFLLKDDRDDLLSNHEAKARTAFGEGTSEGEVIR